MQFNLAAVTPCANGNVVCTVTHVYRTHLGIKVAVHVGEVNCTILGCDVIDDSVGNAILVCL